jgi:hypothetical protein
LLNALATIDRSDQLAGTSTAPDLWWDDSEPDVCGARLLAPVAGELEAAGVRYCVLRPCSRLRRVSGVELDLLVHAADLECLRAVLRRLGYVRLPCGNDPRHRHFVQYVETCDAWLKLDVVTTMSFGSPDAPARLPRLAERCLRRRIRCGSWFTPAPDDELMALVLHSTCDKGYFPDRHRRRLSQLARDPRIGGGPRDSSPWQKGAVPLRTWVSPFKAAWSPGDGPIWPRAAKAGRDPLDAVSSDWRDLIAREAWDELLRGCRAVVRRLCPAPNRTWAALRRTGQRLAWATRVLCGVWRPRGMSLAVLAPAGSDEWRVIDWLCPSMALPTRWPRDDGGTPSRSPGFGRWRPRLRRWWQLLQTHFYKAAGRVVVRQGFSLDLAKPRSLPDLVLLIDPSGVTIQPESAGPSPRACEILRGVWVVDARRPVRDLNREIARRVWQQYRARGD